MHFLIVFRMQEESFVGGMVQAAVCPAPIEQVSLGMERSDMEWPAMEVRAFEGSVPEIGVIEVVASRSGGVCASDFIYNGECHSVWVFLVLS